MFGRRKRQEEAAAEAAREAERRALFAQLAERPDTSVPSSAWPTTAAGYVEGVSDDHRCYAFGDPAPLSAEQQAGLPGARLRQLPALPPRRARHSDRGAGGAAAAAGRGPAPAAPPPAPPPPAARRRRRLTTPIVLIPILLLLLGGATAGYLYFGGALGLVAQGSATPSPTAEPTSRGDPRPRAERSPAQAWRRRPRASRVEGARSPSMRCAVGRDYLLFALDDNGVLTDSRDVPFGGFSYARPATPRVGDGDVYWETADGDLEGWSYLWPDSGNFRIRAVFLSTEGRATLRVPSPGRADRVPGVHARSLTLPGRTSASRRFATALDVLAENPHLPARKTP